jgi:hypothetical protein
MDDGDFHYSLQLFQKTLIIFLYYFTWKIYFQPDSLHIVQVSIKAALIDVKYILKSFFKFKFYLRVTNG